MSAEIFALVLRTPGMPSAEHIADAVYVVPAGETENSRPDTLEFSPRDPTLAERPRFLPVGERELNDDGSGYVFDGAFIWSPHPDFTRRFGSVPIPLVATWKEN